MKKLWKKYGKEVVEISEKEREKDIPVWAKSKSHRDDKGHDITHPDHDPTTLYIPNYVRKTFSGTQL